MYRFISTDAAMDIATVAIGKAAIFPIEDGSISRTSDAMKATTGQ